MDEDENFLISPCFAIDPDVELKEHPTNGHEYLLSVINERRNCPAVATCDLDLSAFKNRQTVFAPELPQMIPAPHGLRPTNEWQMVQIADFSDMRMYITGLLADKSSWPIALKQISINNTPSTLKRFLSANSPSLSKVLSLKQSMLHRLLENIIEAMDDISAGETVDAVTGQWIYAILTCINLPLLSEVLGILRDLARKCSVLRSLIDPDSTDAIAKATPFNIFITIVTRYFGQSDLNV